MEKQYSKDYFQLVQENDRLMDKELKTKRLSYFQDAMLRFTKNKYNVIATIVLVIMILLSIFVPVLTPEDLYTKTNSSLTMLPPRVPLIEKLGILDGTKVYKEQPIDYTTIDPETGLGYPTVGFQKDYIFMDTLENHVIIGSVLDPKYVGGTNDLHLNAGKTSYAIVATDYYTYVRGMKVQIDVNSIDPTGVLEVYLAPTDEPLANQTWADLPLLGTITEAGVTAFTAVPKVPMNSAAYVVLRYVLPEPSAHGDEFVSLNSVSVINNVGEPLQEFSGYDLAIFPFYVIDSANENGFYVRTNAEMIVSSFRYDVYGALFSDKPKTIGTMEYEKILNDNPGMAETIVVDPDNPDHWTFGEGFPITEVVGKTYKTIQGVDYVNYKVMLNGRYSLGFDTIPYFIMGTDVFGMDLNALIWLGLRTSLLLGFLASIFNIIVGVIWGATSAYYGGQVDILMERFTDIWGSFPQITMIGIITVLIGPGFLALFIFVVYDGWIGAAKITRTQFYRYKGREYVLAARTLGASDRRIIFKHILPNALGTIVTRVILSIPGIIFLEVNLSYLGFGIGNGQKLVLGPIELTGTSIGVILNDGQQQIFAGNLWLIVFPTIIVSILMITFNMFGNALRDALNPQLRGSE